ncbi:hypothetical protein BOTBODRAFT_40399 [Botryobasidium botryosum FD-172 SS1]|uniref:Carbonic anhydrase n=1 Tax=Botryobasidium botryosum (strain FD-172 SS1) TaxID=930990 RepID=A0A067N124_BOTB1|nr:hypothetical protein BOTBODRAFT_40399 [Botryobasidium botryosum FD-172 SS1]
MYTPTLILVGLLSNVALANPIRLGQVSRRDNTPDVSAAASAPEITALLQGNQRFRTKTDPNLLSNLAKNGQKPDFLFIGCSDSRVSEGTIFDAQPGTLFGERNIANQFSSGDPNANSILSYAVTELGVKHVLVVGHTGCGGVAASIASPPTPPLDAAGQSIQTWINPIRELYHTSNRTEIVALRNANAGHSHVDAPGIDDPGFRALIEENVKKSVNSIASGTIITDHWKAYTSGHHRRAEAGPLVPVFIHGWVYDIAKGTIKDLKVSQGPPGVPVPSALEAVAAAIGVEVDVLEPEAAEPAPEPAPEPEVAEPAFEETYY